MTLYCLPVGSTTAMHTFSKWCDYNIAILLVNDDDALQTWSDFEKQSGS